MSMDTLQRRIRVEQCQSGSSLLLCFYFRFSFNFPLIIQEPLFLPWFLCHLFASWPTPKSQKPGVQIVLQVVRPWAIQRAAWEFCSNFSFACQHVYLFIFEMNFDLPYFNIFQSFWNTCELGCPKKTRGFALTLGCLSNRRSDPTSLSLQGLSLNPQAAVVAICVLVKLQSAQRVESQLIGG